MEIDYKGIHTGCVTFCGKASNMSDPSETILVIRLPHLTPREEKTVIDIVQPIITNIIKLLKKVKE